MNSGIKSGFKGIFIPSYIGGGNPANDGLALVSDSTQEGGAKLATVSGSSSNVFHGARAVASAQSAALADNIETSVLLDTNSYDTDAFHSITVNTPRITIPAGLAGRYLIICSVTFLLATHATLLQLMIRKNGATYLGYRTLYATTVSQRYTLALTEIAPLLVGDYIEMRVIATNGFAEVKIESEAYSPGATDFIASLIAA